MSVQPWALTLRPLVYVSALLVVLLATNSPARASCEKKSGLASEAALRLTDSLQVEKSDSAQAMRDIDHFVDATSKLAAEDCVGEGPALSDLTAVLTGWSQFAFDANVNSDGSVRTWGTNSIYTLISAMSTEQTAKCRLYARREAIRNIILQSISLRAYRASESLEARSVIRLLWNKASDFSAYISGFAFPPLSSSESEYRTRIIQVSKRMLSKFGIDVSSTEPNRPACYYLSNNSTGAEK
jgi:hypothetical protein